MNGDRLQKLNALAESTLLNLLHEDEDPLRFDLHPSDRSWIIVSAESPYFIQTTCRRVDQTLVNPAVETTIGQTLHSIQPYVDSEDWQRLLFHALRGCRSVGKAFVRGVGGVKSWTEVLCLPLLDPCDPINRLILIAIYPAITNSSMPGMGMFFENPETSATSTSLLQQQQQQSADPISAPKQRGRRPSPRRTSRSCSPSTARRAWASRSRTC